MIFFRTNASVQGVGETDYGNLSPKSKAWAGMPVNFVYTQYFREHSESSDSKNNADSEQIY